MLENIKLFGKDGTTQLTKAENVYMITATLSFTDEEGEPLELEFNEDNASSSINNPNGEMTLFDLFIAIKEHTIEDGVEALLNYWKVDFAVTKGNMISVNYSIATALAEGNPKGLPAIDADDNTIVYTFKPGEEAVIPPITSEHVQGVHNAIIEWKWFTDQLGRASLLNRFATLYEESNFGGTHAGTIFELWHQTD